MKSVKLLASLVAFMVLFCLNDATSQWLSNGDHIYNTNTGNVGVSTSTPSSLLHVAKYMGEPTITIQNLGAGGGATYSMIDNLSGANWKFKATTTGGFKIRDQANLLDVFQIEPNSVANALYIKSGGNVGIHTSTPDALLHVYVDNNSISQLGYTDAICNYFYHVEEPEDGDGQAALYARKTRSSESDGSGYGLYSANCAMKGYDSWGDEYSFGTCGYSYLIYTRCGGILGSNWAGATWGALAYKSSGSTLYGGYFSTAPGNGGGKAGQPACTGIGIGAWGDLMGADIHGKIYGTYTEGENYALFTNGTTYKNDLDVHLQNNGNGNNTPLYTNVSTGVTIMTSGTAILSQGKAEIIFDRSFSECVSPKEPVIVTVTPIGKCNGVFLTEVTSAGCSIEETNSGKSNVMVNYIAVGKRAGYEAPQLAKEVIDAGYVNKLSRGLHNDNNLETNGEGLYFENGELIVGQHPVGIQEERIPVQREEVQVINNSGPDSR